MQSNLIQQLSAAPMTYNPWAGYKRSLHGWSSLTHRNFHWEMRNHKNKLTTMLHLFSALDISTGPLHFSDRRASSGQYILSFTGPYGPPRYRSGHQISISGGPNDDKSQYVLFARAPVPHLGSFRAVLLLQRDASMTRVGVRHVNQTHWRQCLDHDVRNTSMRTSGKHPGAFLPEAHGMVSSKQFCVLVG